MLTNEVEDYNENITAVNTPTSTTLGTPFTTVKTTTEVVNVTTAKGEQMILGS